jgi:hypothetical protein
MSSHMFTPLKRHPEAGIKMAARFSFHGIEPWANGIKALKANLGRRLGHEDLSWISLAFNYVDMPPGVSIEQDMAAHRKYLVETLHASLGAMK